MGGVLGVMLAAWAVPILVALSPGELRGFSVIALNRDVLAFTVIASLLTGILFGLIPAFSATRSSLGQVLREGQRGSARIRGRGVLIAGEVGVSLILLVGAGLMLKSFAKLTRVDTGFNPDRLLVFNIGYPSSTEVARQTAFYQRVIEQLHSLPGVISAGAVSRLPFSGGNSTRSFNLPGSDKSYDADIRVITPGYFPTMGIPLLKGRMFTEHDSAGAPLIGVINEAMARNVFAGEDPIGKFVTNFGPNNDKIQIVGIVGNVRHLALESAPRAEIYQPLGQGQWPSMFVALRSATSDPRTLISAAQNAVWSVDNNIPLANVRTMRDMIGASIVRRKFAMLLLAIFAGLAVLLATIGLYGVMSYSVSQRTREIGIRVALGAQRADVLRLVISQGMLFVIIGVTAGIVSSLGVTRLIMSLLFAVSPTDIGTFVEVSALLALVALFACWLPARRASAVDPVVALRES
jgi:putative ABC transport system permease protein